MTPSKRIEPAGGQRTGSWLKFIVSVILPTMLVILVSIFSVYAYIVPSFKQSFLDGKRDMIRELVNVAWSIVVLYEEQERSGLMSREAAQRSAIEEIEHLRYGREGRDYFWISDMQPRLIMHPYSKELIGTDLSTFEDAGGKRLFMEIKRALTDRDSSFIDYIWNRKYAEIREVPKLSYVKKFEPWQWVIGTGVYLDDVEQKTGEITRRLTRMVHIGVAVIVSLLAIIVLRSLSIERRRNAAEDDLRHSRATYKALVEAAIDPIMMIHNGSCIYANKGMEDLLGYGAAELESLNLGELVVSSSGTGAGGREVWENALHGYIVAGRHELVLRRRDGRSVEVQIGLTRKDLGSQKVVVMTTRDVSAVKRIEEALAESRERFRELADRFGIGLFRTGGGERFSFIQVNTAATRVFGTDEQRLMKTGLLEYLADEQERRELADELAGQAVIREKMVKIRRSDGSTTVASLSLVTGQSVDDGQRYCDGLIEDISRRLKTEVEREELIVELQTSLMFLNQPIRRFGASFVSCSPETLISDAATVMTKQRHSAILVADKTGDMVGIATDLAIREQVATGLVNVAEPVSRIMSVPLVSIDESALLFEAALLMQEHGVKHLAVRDSTGCVVGVISNDALLEVHRYSSSFLLAVINRSATVKEIGDALGRVPRIIKALIDCGAHAENITRVVTAISDAVLQRLIELAVREQGEPPVPFAFISVGSEGRGEQTLVTDQDNAIIFSDVADDQVAGIKDYFNRLGTRVCNWLDAVGYRFCSGNIMAMNPVWCQPLASWKGYFSKWIAASGPEELMEVSIFFDFRCLYGTRRLTDELHQHIRSRAMKRAPFLYQMAQNTLLFKVPIDFFGNIAVESGGDHPNTFNIKHVIAQIVGFARIQAIYHGLESPGTLERLSRLQEKEVLSGELHDELREAYNYLMQLRLRHQLRAVDKNAEPDNHVSLSELSPMEKEVLETIFAQINQLRKRLSKIGESELFF